MKPHWYRDDELPPSIGVLFVRLLVLAAAILAFGLLFGCAHADRVYTPRPSVQRGYVGLDMVATRKPAIDPLAVDFVAILIGNEDLRERCVSLWALDYGDGSTPGISSSSCDHRGIKFNHEYRDYGAYRAEMTVTIDSSPYRWEMPVTLDPVEVVQ